MEFQAFKQCEDVIFISNVPIQKQYKAAFNDIWCNAEYQGSNSNTLAGNKKAPITAYNNSNNNSMYQRCLWTRRQNQNGYRNGGF